MTEEYRQRRQFSAPSGGDSSKFDRKSPENDLFRVEVPDEASGPILDRDVTRGVLLIHVSHAAVGILHQ